MKRREFITGLGGAAVIAPFAAQAQRPASLVGFVHAASATSTKEQYEAFRGGMTALGYAEGRNIRYESRFAEGRLDRLTTLAEEMVRLNPAVIVSAPLPANIAVKKATGTGPRVAV